MPASRRIITLSIAFTAIFLFSSKTTLAQVVINELIPNPNQGSDWVELYNSSNQGIDLDGWVLDDEGTKTNMVKIKEATISAYGFWVFEVGSRLNKSSDTVYLINHQGAIVDEYHYSANPGDGVSLGRNPDGGTWGVCHQPTPESENDCFFSPPNGEPPPSSEPTQVSVDQTPFSSPTGVSSPRPVKVLGGTFLGEAEVTPAGFFPWEATKEGEDQASPESALVKPLTKVFLGLGLILLFSAALFFWYNLRRSERS